MFDIRKKYLLVVSIDTMGECRPELVIHLEMKFEQCEDFEIIIVWKDLLEHAYLLYLNQRHQIVHQLLG